MFLKRGESSRSFRARTMSWQREVLIAIELPAGKRDQGDGLSRHCVDRHEHLHDMVFGQLVEDDGWHRERVGPERVERRMEGEQPVLAIDGAQGALTFLCTFSVTALLDDRVERGARRSEMMTAPGMDGRACACRHCSCAGRAPRSARRMICRWYAFSFEAMRRSSRSQLILGAAPRRPPRTGWCPDPRSARPRNARACRCRLQSGRPGRTGRTGACGWRQR